MRFLASILVTPLVVVALMSGCSGRTRSGFVPAAASTSVAATTSAHPVVQLSVPVVPQIATAAVAPVGSGRTRWPIVLVHGAGGFVKLGKIEYFKDVPARLRSRGHEVLVPAVPAVHTVDRRSRELRDQILAAYPSPSTKVNIIGHSMGGIDARAAITHLGLGPRVASLTTIGTPHRGTAVADATTVLTPPAIQASIDRALNAVGLDWNQVPELTGHHMQTLFNPTTPDAPGVFYQSFAGVADPKKGSGARLSPVMWPSWGIIVAPEGPNDGMVSALSAQWGLWRGTIKADHLGEIGWGSSGFDHLDFYENLAFDLARRGF